MEAKKIESTLKQKEKLLRQVRLEKARRSFFDFCNMQDPEHYQHTRPHLVKLCQVLEDFYKGKLLKKEGTLYKKLLIDMSPQYRLTRTLIMLGKWIVLSGNDIIDDFEIEIGEFKGIDDDVYVLKMEAYDKETDTMLCPDFLSKERYDYLKRTMDSEIFQANYHQEYKETGKEKA